MNKIAHAFCMHDINNGNDNYNIVMKLKCNNF